MFYCERKNCSIREAPIAGNDTLSCQTGFAIGRQNDQPQHKIIIETNNLIILQKSLGIEIAISNQILEQADEIIINGYVFKKE